MTGGAPMRILVPVPGAEHEVLVGTGLLSRLPDLVALGPHVRRAAVLRTASVAAHAGEVETALRGAGLAVAVLEVPDGEAAKTPAVLVDAWERLAALPHGRDDLVVGVGGGAVTDLAGFVAASWNRGVGVVQVPTTLQGQVDAAIGGKTGINLPAGKNLVGAFHQPLAVVCDIATLATVPARDRRAGLGEVVKYGFIDDPAVLELLEARPADAVAGAPDLLVDVVARSVRTKARVVAADAHESGERALLNYGHTLGHAIEACTGYGTYRHGEAVGLGLVVAAALGERLGVSTGGLAERTRAILAPLGLPVDGLVVEDGPLLAAMARDKKARDGIRFVLCRTPGDAYLSEPIPTDDLRAAIGAVR